VVDFDFAHIRKLAGLEIKESEARKILVALGFEVSGKGATVKVTAPSWRPDVHGTADIVEEVARIVGLDIIPSAPMSRLHGVSQPVLTTAQRRARRARRMMAGRGLVEAVTWSFIPRQHAHLFGGGQDSLELDNPISTEMSSMRPSLLPGLLTAAQKNRNRGFTDVGLFELGQIYRGDRPEDQLIAAAAVRAGTALLTGAGRLWDAPTREAGFFDAKADVFALLAGLGFDPSRAQITRGAPDWFHPGRSASLQLGPKIVLAHFGEVHPQVLRALDVAAPVAACEVFLGALPGEKHKVQKRPPLSAGDLLPVTRDFAFILDKDVPAGDVVRAAQAADRALITRVGVFDVFEGGSVGANKKSVAIEVTLEPKEKTLTDQEIDLVSKKIISEVKRVTGGEIRG
jgi:phenylalanyl-tRNA synthetase beta chain